MTPRERVEAVLTGKMPDQIPFTAYPNEIPDQNCREILLAKGLCLVERVRVFKQHSSEVKRTSGEYIDDSDGLRKRRTNYQTPLGDLSSVSAYAQDGTCPQEYLFKTPDDYKKLRFLIEDRRFEEDRAIINRVSSDDSGSIIYRSGFGCEPLQKVINLMGIENFSFEWMENRDEVLKLHDACLEEARRQYPLVAQGPCLHMNCGGNCIPEFIGLERFQQYIVPFYQEASDYMHQHGKLVGTHLDGNTHLWIDEIGGCGLDFIEALTPPPEGDTSVEEALAAWPQVLWLNFPASVHLLGVEKVEATLREILSQAGDGGRIIVGITEIVPKEFARQTFPPLAELLQKIGKLPLK